MNEMEGTENRPQEGDANVLNEAQSQEQAQESVIQSGEQTNPQRDEKHDEPSVTASASATASTPAWRHKGIISALGVIFVILCIGTGYLILQEQESAGVPVKQFANVYSFVPEKISKSAIIPISLPEGVGEADAKAGITFSPELKGAWVTEEREGVILFDPEEALKTGVFYAVNMDTGNVQMSGDFYVDDDPAVQTVFPALDSETNEDSEITIMFNRPMVPLTTLELQEDVPLPITITPETKGWFKWISTRNLQFIPETTLLPSSDYTLTIGEGLVSVDGLPVAPYTHTFTTRPLRYTELSSGNISYRSPMLVRFNQPVDLGKTRELISVQKVDGSNVPIIVEYGEITLYDYETGKSKTQEDRSMIAVYARQDMHRRERLWDFEASYTLTVKGAVPLSGTKLLTEERSQFITIPNIVSSAVAESDRTSQVRLNVFDSEGRLVVRFYEDVDKESSDFNVKGLRGIAYGEKCKVDERGETVALGDSCEKEPDRSMLIFTFNRDAFKLGEVFILELEKIYTPDGFRVNTETIPIEMRVYPEFQILRTVPGQGDGFAALDGMYVCTNVPLKDLGEDEKLSSLIKTSGYIVYGRWTGSYYIETTGSTCESGEYETRINYGLLPETDYTLSLTLADAFGQYREQQVNLKTTGAGELYTRFHNMQQVYNVTSPGHTKLTYATENLEYMNLFICKMSPESFLARTRKSVSEYDPPQSNDCTQTVTDRIELPRRYWVNNYFQVDLQKYFPDTRGHYVLTFSSPLYTSEGGRWDETKNEYVTKKEKRYDHTFVSVTNLAVGKKEVEYADNTGWWGSSNNPAADQPKQSTLARSTNLYWVNNGTTLEPVSGAQVTQYTGDGSQYQPVGPVRRGSSGVTGWDGVARVQAEKQVLGAVVTSGEDSAVVTDWSDMLQYASPAESASRTYIYTDRPIYRPGHTVFAKGIDRIGFDGSYEVWQKDPVSFVVFDSMGATIYDTKLTVSKYGTFSAEFKIPEDAPLGTYRIEAFGQSAWFDVEEYVPAAFKLEVRNDQEEYINGDTINLDVQADYYFGVPLSNGTIEYSVTAQDFYFDRYTDEYFNFGSDWYYCYSCGYGDSYLFRGQTELNEKGHARITRQMKLDDYFTDSESVGSKLVTVSLTARDLNGRAVSTQKTFIVHKGEFYLGAITDKYYTGIGDPITLRLKTVDTKGNPVSLQRIEQKVSKVEWDTFKRQEVDGGFYYRSEKRLTDVKKDVVSTDKNGNWQGSLTLDSEGEYEVTYTKTDERGNAVESTSRIYIYGTNAVTIPPNNNYELDLEVERSNVGVGDTASVLIKSPYDRAKVLITAERGTLYDYWVRDVVGGIYLHEFPIKPEYVPNVHVSALLLSSNPEVKFGSREFRVDSDKHILDVEVSSNKERYLPGEQVTLTIHTKDADGKPVPAEVSLAVADLSVLALKGNPKKDPLMFFYNGFPLSVSTASNIKNILHEVDIPLGTKGGGGDPNDLATKKRGLFLDTAFWNASVVTDSNGEATVTFTLPDNLTTWQIESIGITEDTKVGADYAEFTTKKDLMAVPLKPRFIVPGDTFMLGAKVFNETEHSATIDVKVASPSLVLTGATQESVFVQKGETKTVYFEAQAPADKRRGTHSFTFTASFDSYRDEVEQMIAITPNTTHETVATANMTKAPKSTEFIYLPKEVRSGEGGLTVHANATLAVFMADALKYMVTYPYGCSEQLASALSTIATLQKALSIPNVEGSFDTIEFDGVKYSVADAVEEGLAKIYKAQTESGGFAYYPGLEPDPQLSMHVLIALAKLRDAGFEVKTDVVGRAASYVESTTLEEYKQYPDENRERIIAAEYALRTINGNTNTALTNAVLSLMSNEAFINEQISTESLAYLSIMAGNGLRGAKGAYKLLQNRIDIDGRGAYLKQGISNEWWWDSYETTIKNTALLLKTFAANKDEHPQTGNVLRWLLASRDAHGVWSSTQNTFSVVDAMVDYLRWQHEAEAHFNLAAAIDGKQIFGHEFNALNVFETFDHFVPIDDIERNKLLPLTLLREDLNGRENTLYYDMSLKYYLPVESLPPRDEGITITRELYALDDEDDTTPLSRVKVGDVVKGKIRLITPSDYGHVAIEDMIPAGFEIVNLNLDTEQGTLNTQKVLGGSGKRVIAQNEGLIGRITNGITSLFGSGQAAQYYGGYYEDWNYGYGNDSSESSVKTLWPTHTESHDDRVFLYVESLSSGVYEYEYYLRALVPGTFQQLPARAEELYFPEVFGRTSGEIITVTEE